MLVIGCISTFVFYIYTYLLNARYGSGSVRFASIDVGRWRDCGKILKIDIDGWRFQQIPSIVLFEGGVEKKRVPKFNDDGSVRGSFVSDKSILVKYFELGQYNKDGKKKKK